MQKEIHVNSYVKRDGTQVREHYRTIDSNVSSLLPVSDSGPVIDEQYHNSLEKMFPNIFKTTNSMPNGLVLEGGVSVDVGFPTDGVGDILAVSVM